MIKKENKLQEYTVATMYYDECGDKISYVSARNKCMLCEKDICSKHVFHEEYYGNYPEYYCEKCWTIGEEFRKGIEELEEDIDELKELWYKQCKLINK